MLYSLKVESMASLCLYVQRADFLSLSAVGTLSLSRIRGDRRGVYRVKPSDNPFVCLSLGVWSRLALFFVLPGGAARAIGEKGFCKFVV